MELAGHGWVELGLGLSVVKVMLLLNEFDCKISDQIELCNTSVIIGLILAIYSTPSVYAQTLHIYNTNTSIIRGASFISFIKHILGFSANQNDMSIFALLCFDDIKVSSKMLESVWAIYP